MRIMMVTNNYTPYTGGVVSSINATTDALQRAGHRVTIVTLDFLGKKHADPPWVSRLISPIRFTYKKNHMAIAWRAKKQIKKLLAHERPDVVHVHHPFFLGRIAARCARAENIPVVFTHHTLYEAYAHYVPLPERYVAPLIRQRVFSFCKNVDGIIAPSSAVQDYLVEGQVKVPIRVIPSALQERFWVANPNIRPIQASSLRLLTVGRMVKEKNVEALLRVARKLVDENVSFTFNLIGYGAAYEALKAYAYDELGLCSKQVLFMHQPAKELIAEAYRTADLFLFSSHTDTQGLVLAEAMAAGAPVIALDGPGQRDIIVQGKNGYLVHDEEQMVTHIIRFAKDPARLADFSCAAHVTAHAYRAESLVKKFCAFYEDLQNF